MKVAIRNGVTWRHTLNLTLGAEVCGDHWQSGQEDDGGSGKELGSHNCDYWIYIVFMSTEFWEV